ncbi:unnamed protein product, partial [Mesorhabditis belari]|uniref:Homeobox domain-containing protein n=1 Tax=Mesorhabditis belari TaxID=2138241 RepID=A0AAF3EAU1_9BILA
MVDMVELKPFESRPIEELINQLYAIAELKTTDDNTEEKKHALYTHPKLGVLRHCLLEAKDRYRISNVHEDPDEKDGIQEIARLDNMLLGHGIAGDGIPEVPSSVAEDHEDYRAKLHEQKDKYAQFMTEAAKYQSHFVDNAVKLLDEHGRIRPITQDEKERMAAVVQRKFRKVHIYIKQAVCENLMLLKNRFCDARRKRRNFSKAATDILNEYFFANINNPYPSEELKEELAQRCKISVSQVSNWFGNKRIRFKKSMGRGNVPQPPQSAAPSMPPPASNNSSSTLQPYGMLGMPSMMPYGLLGGADHLTMGGFDLTAYNPQMMAYYSSFGGGGDSMPK